MFTITENSAELAVAFDACVAGVAAAFELPHERATQVHSALGELADSAVICCLPGQELDIASVASQLFGEAHRRSGWNRGSRFLIAPWFLGGSAMRGVALWLHSEATEKALNSGTIDL